MHQRLDHFRKRIEQLKLDAFLVTSSVSNRYLFGFTGSNSLTLITRKRALFVTDRRYTEQSKQEVQNAEVLISKNDLLSELKGLDVAELGNRLGFEALDLSVKSYLDVKKQFPGIKLMASERIVEKIAAAKDETEVENIRRAADICLQVLKELVHEIRPGISEVEISAELTYRTKRLGSERDPFEPIVASGYRSALPHGLPSSKELEHGDLVIMDFGAVVNGYAADVTRTLVLGQPSAKQTEMADAVLAALETAERAAKPGMSGKALDEVARKNLRDAGYGEFFQHSLGHGIGLEVHGLPRIGERSQDTLEAGNVITLEPGLYIPDFGGVRIEDDFLLTEGGTENLTPFPRGLICVESV